MSTLNSLMRDGLSPPPSYVCHYCDIELTEENKTKDHVVPRAIGGRDVRWNIVWSCRDCNSRKADKFPVCSCNLCRKTVRRHWEKLHIRADKPGRRELAPSPAR